MTLILSGTNGVSDVDGSASTPAIRGSDSNTGIFFPAADTIAFAEGGAEVARFDSSGNMGVGVTPSAWGTSFRRAFQVGTGAALSGVASGASDYFALTGNAYLDSGPTYRYISSTTATRYEASAAEHRWYTAASGTAGNAISFTQAMTLDSSGNLLVGGTNTNPAQNNVQGIALLPAGWGNFSNSGGAGLYINRKTNDGALVYFFQDGTEEGNISVSGTTVSYNGGHLSRWAQTEGPKDTTLVKGTVLSNLDAMNVYTDAEGNPVPNEQLNKVKVSDVEGDPNVAGVFVNWSYDDDHNVDEINMAMTGDMIIRIAQGVTVQRGDLLMSAGDGTAKPQGDDIVRSKTVAKVTSTHVTCTYPDGSYCVPCVLMAC